MFFGFSGNPKQSRASLRDALDVVAKAKSEVQRKVADSLATIARNCRNGPLADEIIAATAHLRPSAIDEHVLAAVVESTTDAALGAKLEAMGSQCLAGKDPSGIRLVGAAAKALGDRLALAALNRSKIASRLALAVDQGRRAEARRRNRAADHRQASFYLSR